MAPCSDDPRRPELNCTAGEIAQRHAEARLTASVRNRDHRTSVTRPPAGWRSEIRRARAVISNPARCMLTPGFNLPITLNHEQQRPTASDAGNGPPPQKAIGKKISVPDGK